MSVSYERLFTQENPLGGVVELLSQETVRKNLKAALGIIEWEKNALKKEGINLVQTGTFISTNANLYEVCSIVGGGDYAVWEYGITKLNHAGRPVAPKMRQYSTAPGSPEGLIRMIPESDALARSEQSYDTSAVENNVVSFMIDSKDPGITMNTFSPVVIYVENSTVLAHEASNTLQQLGFPSARR